ncbi:MAG: hypothetical protein EHM45_09780 [Desulfobacteraceae bacterium]|nr:MAG: hypothetical protein EHM45_09780 [Desulfobacteraceae bacterium]
MKMWTRDEIQEIINKMGEKASADGSYMTRCLTDLGGAIKEVAGSEIPKGTIVSLKEDGILVKKPNEPEMIFDMPGLVGENGELSDGHLEAVAGGKKGNSFSVGVECGPDGWTGKGSYTHSW